MRSMVRILLLLLWGAVVLGGCDDELENRGVAQSAAPQQNQEGKIVALGDSLTAGLGVALQHSYPAQLQERLRQEGYDFRVINAGVSGETSSGTLSRLDWILGQKPDIVILEIGANDGLRGIDPVLVERNIAAILEKLQEKGVVTVLAGMKMVWNLGEDYTRAFNSLYPRLARRHGVIFMPFFLEGVAADPALNTADGIHPNVQGYRRITTNIYPHVIRAIERLRARGEGGVTDSLGQPR